MPQRSPQNRKESLEDFIRPTVTALVLEELVLCGSGEATAGIILGKLGYEKIAGRNATIFRRLHDCGIVNAGIGPRVSPHGAKPVHYEITKEAAHEYKDLLAERLVRITEVLEVLENKFPGFLAEPTGIPISYTKYEQ